MKSVAVLLAQGFEEVEALTVVDVMRRAGITCHMVSLDDYSVRGCHGIEVMADYLLTETERDDYDMVVLPGGLPGADNLMNSEEVIQWVRDFAEDSEKFVAAICAAPQVLAKAGVVTGKMVTSYPSVVYMDALKGGKYVDNIVVRDGNIITSRGPATALPFAYKLIKALGIESSALRKAMLYDDLCEEMRKN